MDQGGLSFPGLSVSFVSDPASKLFTSLVLAGSFTATTTGTIGEVQTEMGICNSQQDANANDQFIPFWTVGPVYCQTANPTVGPNARQTWGRTDLSAYYPSPPPALPIGATAGQIVSVKVTITFS